MADGVTTNLALTKPEVGASSDTWGTKQNDAFDKIDAVFAADGTGTNVGLHVGTGKTLSALASSVELHDASDATKIVTFDASNVATATTRTVKVPNSNAVLLPTGAVVPYAGSAAPAGYLLCQGQAVSRTTYADLFDVISTTYGAGDASTTFNVPDLGGRTVAGKESSATRLTTAGSGIDGATLAAAGGTQTHTLTTAQLAAHAHTITDPTHAHSISDSGHVHGLVGNYLNKNGIGSGVGDVVLGTGVSIWEGGNTASSGTGISVVAGGTGISGTNNAGSGTAHQNTQPTIVLNYIIAT